jgi:hypothetical protein
MKKFLSIIMILIGINSFSQTMYAKVPDKEYVYDTINDDVYYIDRGYKKIFIGDIKTPGSELNLFVKHHYRGLILSLSGGVLVGTGSFLYTNSSTYVMSSSYVGGGYIKTNYTKKNSGIVGISLGGVLSLIGLVYVLEAPIHVKRAALIMNENGVGISVGIN